MFKSVDDNTTMTTEEYAENYYHVNFGTESGSVFVIDMSNRMIYNSSDGAMYYDGISRSKAYIITDNAYTYATDEDYYGCASLVFEQIGQIMEGHKVASPMRTTSNVLIAIAIAMLLNFCFVKLLSTKRAPKEAEIQKHIIQDCKITNEQAKKTIEKKTYFMILTYIIRALFSKDSSGSGSGSGGFSSGGGSSGGHGF